jgi:hypothetical protein
MIVEAEKKYNLRNGIDTNADDLRRSKVGRS